MDSISSEDWTTIVLRCPECFNSLKFIVRRAALQCPICDKAYPIRGGIPIFSNVNLFKREYAFEMKRYANIALHPPTTYDGLAESYPEKRTKIFKGYLDKIPFYLNIGQGFGQLEKAMDVTSKICLDQCIEFLRYCKEQKIPNTRYVMGFGERMPFATNYFPAVVSDSVFQTLVDQREFMIENARVLKSGGLFLLAITYRWNYPRKPQDFPADNPDLLCLFLKELGIEATVTYRDLKHDKITDYEEGNYLLVVGEKHK